MIHVTKNRLAGLVGLLLTALILSAAAQAASPKTLKVTKQVVIKADPKAVWAVVKDFDSLQKWHPGFSADEIVKGINNNVGAVRKLTLKDGPSFTEELLKYDDSTHSFRYRIIESPLPINTYVSWMQISPGSLHGTTMVTWEGTFKRKALTPKADETDEAVKKLITGVYEAGLTNLKKQVEEAK